MSLLLDDETALLVVRALMRLPPVSGHVIIGLLQAMQQKQDDQGKLIQTTVERLQQMSQSDANFQTELAGIQADMAKQTTVTNSVLVFVQGIKQKLAEAITAAQTAGATDAELAAVKQLHTDLNTNTTALVDATTENTTASKEPPAPAVPTATVDDTGGDAQPG